MHDDGGWRRNGTRYLYESSWYDLRQDEVTLPSGEDIAYPWVEHPGFVVVVPVLDDGRRPDRARPPPRVEPATPELIAARDRRGRVLARDR